MSSVKLPPLHSRSLPPLSSSSTTHASPSTSNINNVSTSSKLNSSDQGFRINWMNMSSGGKEIWKENFSHLDIFDNERVIDIHVPKEILSCKQVAREINFSSQNMIKQLRLVQHIKLHGNTIEHWIFEFGFVIPNSTNTWQNIVDAGTSVLPSNILSGNVIIETSFFDGSEFIGQCNVRVYYV